MQIHVKNSNYGFFSEEPITVTRTEEALSECCGAEVVHGFCRDCKEHAEPMAEIVWCNHAEAVEEEFSDEHNFNDGTYIEVAKTFLKCYKCGAFKDMTYLSNDWEQIDD